MTDRIYYTDPTCREFTGTVTASFVHDGKPAVCLGRSAFYPTSGGQPCDTGTLGPCRVVDVVEVDDRVVHVLDRPLAVGAIATGIIDWDRRFDHMQQHTGQHILSAAFERATTNPTISFHMGTDVSTIDLAHEVKPTDLLRVEADANGVVWDDVAVAIRFVSEEEAVRLPLRKESVRGGTLRLIDISGFDLSACGGTHVRRTGAIGMIAVLGLERFKGGTRVSFACGGRALRSHRVLRTAVAESIRVLSVVPAELPSAIERLQGEAKEQRKALRELRDSLAVFQAEAFLEGAQVIGGVRVVVRALDGCDAGALKSMAAAMTSQAGVVVALFTTAPPTQVVVARSAEVSIDAASVLRGLLSQYGGKGGGKPDLAQGGGLSGDVRQIVWTASGLLEGAIGGGPDPARLR
jgi:alanyl-tRNA synthetase